jgi:SAM-dependent methyltransferase
MSVFDVNNDRRKGLEGLWTLYKCNRCGVIAILPSPSAAELTKYYSVYSHNKTVNFSLSKGSHYPYLRMLYHKISGAIDPRDFIKPENNSRLLDYGCGEAGVLFDFHSRGIKISGAELSSDIVNACQKAGLDVSQVVDPDKIPFQDSSFDTVYLMQVFEHLRDPHGFFEELKRVTRTGGSLYLAVPNYSSFWRRIFGKNWVSGWFTPFHLFQYNKNSLTILAGQHGFDILDSWTKTPESWFRLNLKACLYSKEVKLDERKGILDINIIRIPIMITLRFIELFILQRDCLVVKMIKNGR